MILFNGEHLVIITDVFLPSKRLAEVLSNRGLKVSLIKYEEVEEKLSNLKVPEGTIFIVDLAFNKRIEVIKKIKSLFNDPKIIALGENDVSSYVVETLKSGAIKYIRKPFTLEDMVKTIREILSFSIQPSYIKVEAGGYAIYTKKIQEDTVSIILFGTPNLDTIEKIKDIMSKTRKVIVSLNGVNELPKEFLQSFLEEIINNKEDKKVAIIAFRPNIKLKLLGSGIDQSIIFPNEYSAREYLKEL